MLKKIVDKRIELFKKTFPDYQISKKTGSLYAKVGKSKKHHNVRYIGRNITKGLIDKIGSSVKWTEEKADSVFLMSPKGKFMVSKHGQPFKTVTLKLLSLRDFDEGVQNMFFTGKKYEWMKDYPQIWQYRLFQGFNSLSEAKKFIGFSFISDADFISLFSASSYDCLSPMIFAKDKKNVVRLLRNLDRDDWDLLNDYINMCIDNGFEVEIPAGVNKLQELHDNVMWKVNEKNADKYSNEYRYDVVEEFTEEWVKRGLVFKRLDTPYKMYLQGLKQQHCIGTNYATTLGQNLFYTFTYEGKEYDLQIHNKSIGQFYGRKNSKVPYELRELVTVGINFENKIIDIKPNLKNYPTIEEIDFSVWPF